MECVKCKCIVLINDLVCCFRCGGRFHSRCGGISGPSVKLINASDNVLFKCNDCLSVQSCDEQNVSVLDVDALRQEIKQISSLVADIQNNITAQIGNALKSGMEEMSLNIISTLKQRGDDFDKFISGKMEIMASSFLENKRRQELVEMGNNVSDSDSLNRNVAKKTKKRKLNDDGNCANNETEVLTFASVVRGNIKKRKAGPVIVIKPKESSQSSEATREFLKSNLDPKTHKISNFRNGKDGSVIVECATNDNIEIVKSGIENNLGESYTAVVPVPPVPRLKVMGMSDQYSPDAFIDLLKSQNEAVSIDSIKVISMYENPRFKYNKFNVVIEVDKKSYNSLLTAKKVNVGWDRCHIIPAINILRCFKCGEFGHKSTECKNDEKCSLCSGQHKTSECSSTVSKCINCLKFNKERKMNLDVNHAASSSECSVYKKLYEQKKSSLRFDK